ncbi:MAG: hypothetical protein RSG22_12735 [Comamonas sp.]|jgi:hypothetical protein
MKPPYTVWVLTPHFKPVVVTIIDQYESNNTGLWLVTESGRLRRSDRVYLTLCEAIKAGFALLDKEQADLNRSLISLQKHRAALQTAQK